MAINKLLHKEAEMIKQMKVFFNILMNSHNFIKLMYDGEGDTLTIHFTEPNEADDAKLTENDIIVRYKRNKIIGFTILNFSDIMRMPDNKLKEILIPLLKDNYKEVKLAKKEVRKIAAKRK